MHHPNDRTDAGPPEAASGPGPFQVHALGAYLALAMLVGGAGVSYPLITALIEVGALALLASASWTRRPTQLLAPGAAPNLLLLGILLLPLLQLIPLPWSLWKAMPGHGLAAEVLSVAGLAGGARPVSLNPHATFTAWLSLFPAATLFLLASRLAPAQQRRLAGIAIAVALLSALIGAVQKASGGATLVFFPSDHSANGPGLFIDRNHQATFLLMAMPLVAGFARAADARSVAPLRLAALGLIAILAAAVVATTSRMGLMGLPLAALAAILILFPPRLSAMRIALPILGLIVAAAAVLQSSGARFVLGRFAGHDVRLDYWADAWVGVKQYFPWGAGIGSFQDIYPSLENLNIVGQAITYNAHNDYIELLLDGGAPALLLILAFLVLAAMLAFRVARTRLPSEIGAMKAAACAGTLLVLLCSTLEYPIRSFSIQLLFALFCAIVVARPFRRPTATTEGAERNAAVPERRRRNERRAIPVAGHLAIAGLCVALGAVVAVQGAALQLLLAGHAAEAQKLAPGAWRISFAKSVAATQRRDFAAARRDALASLDAAPMRPEPATVLALAAQESGQPELAARIITAIAPLGWRYGAAQYWMFESALAQGDTGSAVLRADALLRQGLQSESLMRRLRRLARSPEGNAAIAERLAVAPPWRGAFLLNLGKIEPDDVGAHLTLLTALRGTEAPPSRDEIAAFSARLIAEHNYAEAETLWKALAPAMAGKSTLDTGSPFDWTSHPLPGLYVSPSEADASGNEIALNAEGSVSGLAIYRLIRIAPGHYTLRSEMKPAGARENLLWRIVCDASQADLAVGVPRLTTGREGVASEIDFAVPAGCPVIRLALWIDQRLPAERSFMVRKIMIGR